jgi:hypothetical protein
LTSKPSIHQLAFAREDKATECDPSTVVSRYAQKSESTFVIWPASDESSVTKCEFTTRSRLWVPVMHRADRYGGEPTSSPERLLSAAAVSNTTGLGQTTTFDTAWRGVWNAAVNRH